MPDAHYRRFGRQERLRQQDQHGAKVCKLYDTPKTSYQRLLDLRNTHHLEEGRLATSYTCANPVFLLAEIRDTLGQIWTLANRSSLVTRFMTQPKDSR